MLKSIEINGRQLTFEKARVMGIVNLTPDSFYDGGKLQHIPEILGAAERMIQDGASILDIGAVSTRPGATNVPEAEELRRLLPALAALRKAFPETWISVDTYRHRVAEAVLDNGADIINDISGGNLDEAMLASVARYKAPYILMHMQGTPQTMQQAPHYDDVFREVYIFFEERLQQLRQLGHTQVILDPGFGFGKTQEHNYTLLHRLNLFNTLGYPVLAGVSRKSMINKLLHTKPENALNGTTVVNTIALLNNARILRVHDVKEAIQAIEVVEFYKGIQ
ncbi:MAG: dihydropteroate synthase [Bacteroidetes bacterium]|nr:dihydropteroate synthase [Bacteroidota bacterium]